jgi:hypothetical protein
VLAQGAQSCGEINHVGRRLSRRDVDDEDHDSHRREDMRPLVVEI